MQRDGLRAHRDVRRTTPIYRPRVMPDAAFSPVNHLGVQCPSGRVRWTHEVQGVRGLDRGSAVGRCTGEWWQRTWHLTRTRSFAARALGPPDTHFDARAAAALRMHHRTVHSRTQRDLLRAVSRLVYNSFVMCSSKK